MESTQFDHLARAISAVAPRRRVLAALAGGLLAVLPIGIDVSDAEGQRRRHKKRPKPNAYGCLNVGQACRGNSASCCSGICQGKKPKKGKKAKSQCVAHDASTCQTGDDGEICGGLANVSCTTTSGDPGVCHTTTGNAGYCLAVASCEPCQRDQDCDVFFGAGAACLVCGGCAEGTLCAGLGAM